jgi:hypothetical protein
MKSYYGTIRKLAPWVGIWLVLAAIFALVVGTLFRRPYDELVSNGVVTEGLIRQKEPDNHQNVHYSYVVGSETYWGIGHGGQGAMPVFEKLQIGQKVLVVYDRRQPTLSCLGDPKQHLKSANFLTVLAAVLSATFVMAILHSKGHLPGAESLHGALT